MRIGLAILSFLLLVAVSGDLLIAEQVPQLHLHRGVVDLYSAKTAVSTTARPLPDLALIQF